MKTKMPKKDELIHDFENFNYTHDHYRSDPEVDKLYRLFDKAATNVVNSATNPVEIKEKRAAEAYLDFKDALSKAQGIVKTLREREKRREAELLNAWTKTPAPVSLSDALLAVEYLRELDREQQVIAIGETENTELRALLAKARATMGKNILGELDEVFKSAFFEAHKEELTLNSAIAAATDDLLVSFEDGLSNILHYHSGYDVTYAKELAESMVKGTGDGTGTE